MSEHEVKKALGHTGKKPKHHVQGMHIRRAASGGFIAKHDVQDEDGMPATSPEHILPDMDAAQAHLDQHMGDQPAAPQPGADPGGAAGAGPDEQAGA